MATRKSFQIWIIIIILLLLFSVSQLLAHQYRPTRYKKHPSVYYHHPEGESVYSTFHSPLCSVWAKMNYFAEKRIALRSGHLYDDYDELAAGSIAPMDRYSGGGYETDYHQDNYKKIDWKIVLLALLASLLFAALFSTTTFQTFLTNLFNCTAYIGREMDGHHPWGSLVIKLSNNLMQDKQLLERSESLLHYFSLIVPVKWFPFWCTISI